MTCSMSCKGDCCENSRAESSLRASRPRSFATRPSPRVGWGMCWALHVVRGWRLRVASRWWGAPKARAMLRCERMPGALIRRSKVTTSRHLLYDNGVC